MIRANSLTISLAMCGFLGALYASAPRDVRAQAPPGPLAPKTPDSRPDTRPAPPEPTRQTQSAPAIEKEKIAPRQNISGYWKFNRADSDDARNKIQQAERLGNSRNNGPVGGNGPMGGNGPYGGGPMGSPYPGGNGPYGNGPYGRNPNDPNAYPGGYDNDEREIQSPAMREYIYPATGVTFSLKDSEADLADDSARRRVFFTDGRKLQKSKDDNYREIAAHWEGTRLVSEERISTGTNVRRTFDVTPDGHQLEETINLDATRNRSAVQIHYVYNIDPSRQ